MELIAALLSCNPAASLVEEFAGADGRVRFATTEAFLQRFGLASLEELTAASLSGNPDKTPGTQPLI